MCDNKEHQREQNEIKSMLTAIQIEQAKTNTLLSNLTSKTDDQEYRLRITEKISDRNARSIKVLMSVTSAIGLAALGGLVDIVTRLVRG